jgi:hypothetical protein
VGKPGSGNYSVIGLHRGVKMRYSELFQFEPINTLIQIREADEKSKAKNLVSSYVISERMATQLVTVVIPQLQFETPVDNKGVLIVGNYGTGKSHLMSAISAVAEYDDLVGDLDSKNVQKAAKSIAGKFFVIRAEIGSVTGNLRDILVREIERSLKKWGVSYKFPSADKITSNKDALIEAVATFQKKYPDKGVLLVVDELLDFLRTKEERSLILDLGFLREVGEVAALTPFRFVGGLQETLFDNPRFNFVADQLRRVKDRFEQVRIVREDIAYVVSRRLLKKNNKQLAKITEHLRPFTPLYKNMAEKLDEYVSLFPIHPAYIDTFEQVFVAEKREVLRTFSSAMQELLDKDVPENEPGMVSYDHYWAILKDNPSMRTMPDVAEVVEKSEILASRVNNAYSRDRLKSMAMRIINALSVLRLTTNDIYVALGATPEELRDNLCLHVKMPEKSAEFLADQVQVTLREIIRTVSGQYITHNDGNNQYYLDVKKDIDFDAKIADRGEFMEKSDLNRYFYDAMRQILTMSDSTYVTGYEIWEYQLPWQDHRVTRPGYLFFGKPDQRSTAQPPRDFYVYLTPPFDAKEWNGDVESNDVIFQLNGLGQEFEDLVRNYAGARAMAGEAATHRQVYADKSDLALKKLIRWLKENSVNHLQIHFQGVTEPVSVILKKTKSSSSSGLKELIDLISSHFLEPEFAEQYPDYPAFSRLQQPISEDARSASAMDAIRMLAGRGRTNLALAVLEGLGLLDSDGNIRPYSSLYAKKFLELLQKKPDKQVVNRGEIIDTVAKWITPIEKDLFFQLEPEWVVVVLLSLVYSGDIVLSLGAKETLDAGNIEYTAIIAMDDLKDFRHYGRPKELPLGLWTTIFEGLELTPGLIRNENSRSAAIESLQRVVQADLAHIVELEDRLVRQGVTLWNEPIFTDRFGYISEKGVVTSENRPDVTLSINEVKPRLLGYKKLLEELDRFKTVGKLRNLKLTTSEINDALKDREAIQALDGLLKLIDKIQPVTSYLIEAQGNMPTEHPWSERAITLRATLINEIRSIGSGKKTKKSPKDFEREIQSLKSEYIKEYISLHRKLVLGPKDDERRKKLLKDSRLTTMNELSRLNLLNESEFDVWKDWLTKPLACPEFHDKAIEESPTCPFCGLKPKDHISIGEASQHIADLDDLLADMLVRWRMALKDNLTSDTAQASIKAMAPKERKPIEEFLEQNDNVPGLPKGFVDSANKALQGIQSITLPVEELVDALKAGGLPSTLSEIQRRFSEFIQQKMRGHDANNTRLTLDQ